MRVARNKGVQEKCLLTSAGTATPIPLRLRLHSVGAHAASVMSNREMGIYSDLAECLEAKGILKRAYAINEIPDDNTYCIQDSGKTIEVFYLERGIKLDLKSFRCSQKAIEYFELWIQEDPTVFKSFNGTVQ